MTAPTTLRLVQIVPRLAPPAEGVGSYAAALAGALSRLGVETCFVVGDPAWPESEPEGGARAVRVEARTAAALAAALDRAGEGVPVLLHYAGYGYQTRGCPRWLVEGLSDRKPRLLTLFHEVYASGPPWRSSFWTLPLQRRLAAELVRRSADLTTTLTLYAGLLRPWAAGREIAIQPVFSTVGEPEPAAVRWLAARRRRMVVFGGAGVRSRAWAEARPALARACAGLGIEEIADVGPAIAGTAVPEEVGGAPVRRLGVLAAAALSDLLLDSLAGFAVYPPAFLPKSTIFAAYCAHGLLPVCVPWRASAVDRREEGDGLTAGRQYWEAGSRPAGAPAHPQEIADAARSWYAGHSLALQAAAWRERLGRLR